MDWLGGLLNINEWICKTLVGIASWFFNLYYFIIGHTTSSDILGGQFDSIFGSDVVWGFVTKVHETAVIPIAESILALFMLVQLVKISQRIDATSTLPAVKDIVFLTVTYVIMHWLIVNSLDLMKGVYDVFNTVVTSDVFGSANSGDGFFKGALDTENMDYGKASVGGCVLLVILSLCSVFTAIIAYAVSIIVAVARGVQLYVMAAFSPIPFSLLGFDETRQMGVGYLKNFCSACLAGAVMVFLFASYPYILTAMTTSLGADAGNLANLVTTGDMSVTGAVDASLETVFAPVLAIITFIGLSILLVVGLIKSGSWAKQILGN